MLVGSVFSLTVHWLSGSWLSGCRFGLEPIFDRFGGVLGRFLVVLAGLRGSF